MASVSSFVRANNYSVATMDTVHRIGIKKGSYIEKILKAIYPGVTIEQYGRYSDGLFDLLAGYVDAICATTSVILKLSKESGVEDRIRIAGKAIDEFKSALGVQKSNTQFLSQLDGIIANFTFVASCSLLLLQKRARL